MLILRLIYSKIEIVMMLKNILFVALVIAVNVNAQISVNVDSVLFPQTLTGTRDSFLVAVKNNHSQSSALKIRNLKNVYKLSDTLLTIAANDSAIVWIKYQPNQNVIDKDLIFIFSADSTIGSIISVTGSGRFGDDYDATTFNLYDSQLKNVLISLVDNHRSLGYNTARDRMFMEFDNQRVNGQGATQNTLECVYTGRLAVGYSSRSVAQGSPFNFNTEHTWPQSNFNELEPMKSDLYHLFPTDISANSTRSNYPFGKVVSNITWQIGGSRLGLNNIGRLVFEPRDVHKGDVGRSMFYFMIRYPINYGSFFTQEQENVFREWNNFDKVGTVEANRNNAIALLQLKRNPFIDHPEFVDRIFSFVTNNSRPLVAELELLPLKVKFDSTLINNLATRQIYIANSGSSQLVIDSISISNSKFSVGVVNNRIEPFSYSKVEVQFSPDSVKNYNAVLRVFSRVGVKSILLSGIGKDRIVNVEAEKTIPYNFSLGQNYPNPFNPNTQINFSIGEAGVVSLTVYNAIGEMIKELINGNMSEGIHSINFDASELKSGIYFYKLVTSNFRETKKMALVK